MYKAERDHVMTRLSPAERAHFRCLIQDMRTQASAPSGHRCLARQVLAAHGSTVFRGQQPVGLVFGSYT